MTNERNKINDGLDGSIDGDEGSSRLMKGTKIKFTNDFEWVTGDDTVIAADLELIIFEIVKHQQKWIGGRPVETRIFLAHEDLPDTNALNEAAPPEEWCEKFGQRRGPWEWGYTVYLINPKTSQVFTYPTTTTGGGQAVRDLRQAVGMRRRMYGDNQYPVVRFTTEYMKTKFGGRDRPKFEIIDYVELGGAAALPATEQPKQIEAPKPADPPEQKAGKTAAPRGVASKSRKDDPVS